MRCDVSGGGGGVEESGVQGEEVRPAVEDCGTDSDSETVCETDSGDSEEEEKEEEKEEEASGEDRGGRRGTAGGSGRETGSAGGRVWAGLVGGSWVGGGGWGVTRALKDESETVCETDSGDSGEKEQAGRKDKGGRKAWRAKGKGTEGGSVRGSVWAGPVAGNWIGGRPGAR